MFIIFSGFNQRAVIAFIRALEKNNIDEYRILACGGEDPILKTSYRNKVYHIREHRELCKSELYLVLKRIVDEDSCRSVVIVPSTEGLNRFLVENSDEIEALGVSIPLVKKDLYYMISDKRKFWTLCKDNGFIVPQIIQLRNRYTRKYVAKPITYISRSGQRNVPIIVDSEEKHLGFFQSYNISDFDIQEYIEGESIYLLYYIAKTGKNYCFSQRNLVQQSGGKSMVVSISWDTHKDEICYKYISMLRRIGFYGFIMIELRKKNNCFYMIEANPRLWGPSQLFVDACVPFVEAFLVDCGIKVDIPENDSIKKTAYFWSGGIQKSLMDDHDCEWLDGGKEIVEANKELIFASDIYKRPDTYAIYNDEHAFWRG